MLTIEPGEPIPSSTCECCGGTTTTLVRFVYQDGVPFGIYYARFSDNHPDGLMSMAVGVGDFTDGSTPADRTAFAMQMKLVHDHFEVMVVDRTQSPWKDTVVLGEMLNRSEALRHERVGDAFHLTDHMVTDDADIVSYFRGVQHDA